MPELDNRAYENVYRTSDLLQLQAIADFLTSEKISVRKGGGMAGAGIGAGNHIISHTLSVPREQAAAAQELIRSFEEAAPAEAPEEEAESSEPAVRQKKALVAGLLPFVLPLLAGGLYYAEAPIAALIMTVAQWFAFVNSGRGPSGAMFGVLKLAEAVLAVVAVKRLNRGIRTSAAMQVAAVALVIAVIIPFDRWNKRREDEERLIANMGRAMEDDQATRQRDMARRALQQK